MVIVSQPRMYIFNYFHITLSHLSLPLDILMGRILQIVERHVVGKGWIPSTFNQFYASILMDKANPEPAALHNVLNLLELGSKVQSTVCPGSSDLFYIVSYYIKWITTSWTHSTTNAYY